MGYTREDIVESIRAAADSCGEPLTYEDYREWRDTVDGHPSIATVYNHFEGWGVACDAANVRSGPTTHGEDDLLDAIIRIRDIVDMWPTTEQYREHRRSGEPATTWLYKESKYAGWGEAIDDAKSRSNHSLQPDTGHTDG